MRVALYDCGEKVFNTALMQISSFHKSQGDLVLWYHPLMHDTYDKIYCSSLFDFTDKSYVRDDMICGGTGFNLDTILPHEIESCEYDYSIYPECDYSILWFSRGCIRKCPFCVVSKKEGMIYPVEIKNLNPNGNHIKVMDNNFFANPNWKQAIEYLLDTGQKVDLQGVDIRILDNERVEALNKLRYYKGLHIAWDNPKDNLIDKMKKLLEKVPAYKIMCYVLIGYWSTPEEDLMRVEKLRELKISPFVMPFNKSDQYQKNFARWVNHKAIFKTVKWNEYK